VLTLWRPQRELLSGDRSPLDEDTKRMVLSVPTSGGKTLLAQLLMVAHLARQDTSVCYVAPTRSLCREVRRAMGTRLRILQQEIDREAPEFPLPPDLFAFLAQGAPAEPPDVEVMTPERLSHLLRHDPQAVLDRFGLFVFDEAQLVQESGRGFTLEAAISYLNVRTRDTHHRLVLVSAGLGNRGQIMSWIDPAGQGVLHHSEWRGPRRMFAVFSTDPDFNSGTTVTTRSKTNPYRMTYPLHGVIRLRPADGRPERWLRTLAPIGQLALKASTAEQRAGREKDDSHSTRQYVLAASMIGELGHAGSVLVVAGTRATAERLAGQLAADLPRNSATVALTDFARLQLGADHPLVATLRHGVGFHHAGLPTEVLEAMEDALREDLLPYLTCTSTLTDGVNLPVRTVVLYDETYPPEARLSGARMVNAMGRAGRSGKESEGWIVLVRAARRRPSDFDDLRPTADDLTATSTMATDEALTELAELEDVSRGRHDAIFDTASAAAADFVSFLWFALAADEQADLAPEESDLAGLLAATLAARQVPDELTRWQATAETVRTVYLSTDPVVRRRWARAGTSVGSARHLDGLAGRVMDRIHAMDFSEIEVLRDPLPMLGLLDEAGVLEELLGLPENSTEWLFRARPRSNGFIPVEPRAVLGLWLAGTPLAELADEVLREIADPSWRISQLVDAVTAHFEHFLAWTVGALMQLINEALVDAGLVFPLCPELPGYIRYGVQDPPALALMLAGVRSRRLAHDISRQLPEDVAASQVAEWLGDMSLLTWRESFHASPSEVLDLLAITRTSRGSLLRPLLETGSARLDVRLTNSLGGEQRPEVIPVRVAPVPDQPAPAAIGFFRENDLLAEVPPVSHTDVAAVLDTGLEVIAHLRAHTNPPTVTMSLLSDGPAAS
jgi:hypothetical protein